MTVVAVLAVCGDETVSASDSLATAMKLPTRGTTDPVLGVLSTAACVVIEVILPATRLPPSVTAGVVGLDAAIVVASTVGAASYRDRRSRNREVVVVVGDPVKEGFDEHWTEDFHHHGAIGGLATGVGHIAVNIGKNVNQPFSGLWNTVTD